MNIVEAFADSIARLGESLRGVVYECRMGAHPPINHISAAVPFGSNRPELGRAHPPCFMFPLRRVTSRAVHRMRLLTHLASQSRVALLGWRINEDQ